MRDRNILSILQDLQELHRIDLDVSRVITDISPGDTMYVQGSERHYFKAGFSGLESIVDALSWARKGSEEIRTILDLPCGCGRVLRFIRAFFPEAEITASEIDENALDFCSTRFGVHTLRSSHDFTRIPRERQYDLIWCGSLFTHLDQDRTKDLLKFLYDSLKEEGGVLVLTTHGRYPATVLSSMTSDEPDPYGLSLQQRRSLLKSYAATGYGFSPSSGPSKYGISFIKPSWMTGIIEEYGDLQILAFKEKTWDDHQDVFACHKRSYMTLFHERLGISGQEVQTQLP